MGAGYTGLWTAYYLLRAAPGTRVALLEREVAGFGASGRNGGWCSALFPASGAKIARHYGTDAARAMRLAMQRSVDEVGRAAAGGGGGGVRPLLVASALNTQAGVPASGNAEVRARVRADIVVRSLEGWTPALAGHHRALLPVYSLMIATEPLGDSFWQQAGLARRETFSDGRHLIIYGQRTADGRLAFGGRGAPYHFASGVRAAYDRVPRVHDALHRALVDLFPDLGESEVTHAWGGPLGVPRDWFASVGLDRATGTAWAGGYVGDGVATSNLAGRTLAGLILGHDGELVGLPWVGHRSPAWEPEPLRWLGVRGALWATKFADCAEQRQGVPSVVAGRLERLLGH